MKPIEVTRQIGEHQVRVVCSMLTGREQVFVDGREVSNKLSWRLRTRHRIDLEPHQLEVEVMVASLWEGRLGIRFRLDGETVGVTRWALGDDGLSEESEAESRWLADWRLPGWLSALFWMPYIALIALDMVATFSGKEDAVNALISTGLMALGGVGVLLMVFSWLRGMVLSTRPS